jgi:N-acetylglucosaminyldiphosphoundecaprenol N-acetyl-beta-D-mannosaminyltransferase
MESIIVGGIRTVRANRASLAERMLKDCKDAESGRLRQPKVVVSSNGAVVARYHSDPDFRQLIDNADFVDADGASVVFASRMFCAVPLQERVATTDFVHDCCATAVRNSLRFFFLGGKPGVAERAARHLKKLYPGLQIVGVRDGYFRADEEAGICEEVVSRGTSVLWLGMGSPLQERFAIKHRDSLAGLGWIRTCGGLFDHLVGNVSRAPLWMQRLGLEWLHRARKEPMRLGPRYLKSNPVAAYHLLTKTYDSGRWRTAKHRAVSDKK